MVVPWETEGTMREANAEGLSWEASLDVVQWAEKSLEGKPWTEEELLVRNHELAMARTGQGGKKVS